MRRRHGPPKPIPQPKVRLDVSGLAAAYDWLPVDKASGFRLAFEWYERSMPMLLVGHPLTVEENGLYEKAKKLSELGLAPGPWEPERESACKKGLRILEKIWVAKKLPGIDAVASSASPSPRISKMFAVLAHLNDAYATMNMRYVPTLGVERDFTPAGMFVPVAELAQMVGQPPIKTVLKEVMVVAKAKSIVTRPGVPPVVELDSELLTANAAAAVDAACGWAERANAAAMRPLGKVGRVKGAKQPVQKVPLAVVCPFGIFKRNTAKAAISKVLSDRAFHKIVELKALCKAHGISQGQVKYAIAELQQRAKLVLEFSPDKSSVRIK